MQTLYLIVELENALHNEYTIRSTETADGAEHSTRSPYQLQLALEVHRRFVGEHVQQLCCDRLAELWTATIAWLAPGEDGGWMERALTAVWSSADGRAVEQRADSLAAVLDEAGAAGGPAAQKRLVAWCDVLEREDKRVLHELKLVLRAGVQVFEVNQEHTALVGSAQLLEGVRESPTLFAAYCVRPTARSQARCNSPQRRLPKPVPALAKV